MNVLSVSIVVCCRNAADRIGDTLWSLVLQSAEASTYEVLVVDNVSDDREQLRLLVHGMDPAGRRIRLLEEPAIGLSPARNRGVRESSGEYVVFIDDDAVAGARFVEHYLQSIGQHRPDVLGGNVLPWFCVQPPSELDYTWWPRWSLKHFGPEDRWLGDGEYFIGTNIGARRALLLEHPFDPTLGRAGERLLGGEECFLGSPAFRRRFVAGAYVLHKVPPERMTTDYLARRSWGSLQQESRPVSLAGQTAGVARAALRDLRLMLRRIAFQVSLRKRIWRLSKKDLFRDVR